MQAKLFESLFPEFEVANMQGDRLSAMNSHWQTAGQNPLLLNIFYFVMGMLVLYVVLKVILSSVQKTEEKRLKQKKRETAEQLNKPYDPQFEKNKPENLKNKKRKK